MAQYAVTEHEYSLNNGSTWQTCTAPMDNADGTATIPVGDVEIPIGHLKVRVKASGNRPAGAILSNTVAFTQDVVVPVGGGAALVSSNYSDLSGDTQTERDANAALFTGMETASIYHKFAAFYPLTGGNVNNLRFNAMDPKNDYSAFAIEYLGTPVKHAKGIHWADGGHGKIYFNAANLSGLPTVGLGCYAQDTNLQYAFLANANGFDLGVSDGGKRYVGVGASSAGVAVAPTTGLIYGQREDTTTVKSYSGDTEQTSETLGINIWTSTHLLLLGSGAPVVSAYFIMNESLTAGERTTFKNLMNTWATSLGRNI